MCLGLNPCTNSGAHKSCLVSATILALPQPPSLEAVPSDKDFVAALRAVGLHTKATADKSSSSAKDGVKAPDTHAVVKGTMYHLQLLLRTFAAVCRYQQQVTIVLCVTECVDAPPMSLCCLAHFTMQPLLVYHAAIVGVSCSPCWCIMQPLLTYQEQAGHFSTDLLTLQYRSSFLDLQGQRLWDYSSA